jgi:hypothetical protein
MEYKPNKWIILKITADNKVYYKVLAGWNGGYLDGLSWRMNSGITKIILDDNFYYFHGYSGSVYKCHKNLYGTNSVMDSVIREISMTHGSNYNYEILENQDFSLLILDNNLEM